jgi:hypothetical protein
MKSPRVIARLSLCVAAVLFFTPTGVARSAGSDGIQWCTDSYADACDVGSACSCDDTIGCGDLVGCGDEVGCGDCVAGCCSRGYGNYFWLQGEYLLWRTNGQGLPPLVTSSPIGTPLNQAGQLGLPSTTVVGGGGGAFGDDWRSGYLIQGGVWLDHCRGLAVVGDYFNTGRDAYNFVGGPTTNTILARPFFNSQLGVPDAELVSVPNELEGQVRVSSFSDFQGAGVGLQKCLWDCGNSCKSQQLQLIGGYRYYQQNSLLYVSENLTVLPGTTSPLVPGTQIQLQDKFAANNVFNGGDIGLQGRFWRQKWFFDGMAKVAIGANHRTVYISGNTTNTVPGFAPVPAGGGLLTADGRNIGTYSDTRVAVIPQFRLGLGYQLTPSLSLKTGYNVILWNDVAQAASALPPGLAVDPRNLPPVQPGGGTDPLFPGIKGTSFVAHGFDFGLQLAY